MTRGQFASLTARILALLDDDDEQAPNHADAMGRLVDVDVVIGFDDGDLGVQRDINRARASTPSTGCSPHRTPALAERSTASTTCLAPPVLPSAMWL